jgi:hypothetical protein
VADERGIVAGVAAEHLATLKDRCRYLHARFLAKESVGWETVYDEREYMALEWAIALLADLASANDGALVRAILQGDDSA